MIKIIFLLTCGFWGTGLAWAQPELSAPTVSSDATVETLVCIRHGERSHPQELGQLSIQGLNRALALPQVLLSKYGKPQYLFAPDPSEKIKGKKGSACYVRPLATIEPTAIYCKDEVNTMFGAGRIKELEAELEKPLYANALIFIAWEHAFLKNFVHQVVVDHGGDGSQVPFWQGGDYDSIYVVKLTRQNGHVSVSFTLDRENLNGLSKVYPGPAPVLPPEL